MQIYLKIFVALFFFLMTAVGATAESTISLKDTSLKSGEKIFLPIESTFNNKTVNSVKLKLVYNALVIDFPSVLAGDGFAMKCKSPVVTRDFTDITQATITISCDSIDAASSVLLCALEIEGLVGPDSVTYIKPDSLFINGVYENAYIFRNGKVTVIGDPVFQRYPEGLGMNYPNPVEFYTVFPFTIDTETPVNFYIYKESGARIAIVEELTTDNFILKKKDEINGDSVIVDLTAKLARGNYQLEFYSPLLEDYSSGLYYLLMKTDNGAYNRSFIFCR